MPTHLKQANPITAAGNATKGLDVPTTVKNVIEDIRSHGDAAVPEYSQKFDSWDPSSFRLARTNSSMSLLRSPNRL